MRKVALLAAAGALVLGVVVVVLGAGRLGALVLVGLLAVLALSVIPERFLPALCLALWALVPRRLTVELFGVEMVFPLVFVMALWAIRSFRAQRDEQLVDRARPVMMWLFIALAIWFAFVTVIGRHWGQSLTWVLAFILLWAVPSLLSHRRMLAPLVKTWMVLAVILGLYALVEAFFQQNFVYGRVLDTFAGEEAQRWSVYRASASFGHPLYASLFFSAAFALALGKLIETPKKRYAVVALIAALAMVSTVSRTGLVAAAVAAAIVLLLAVVRARISGMAKFGLVAATAAGLLLATSSGAFLERSGSGEASSSSVAREWVFSLAFEAASRSGWIGSGPGTSADTVRALDSFQILVENAYLQLLVSVGIPGLLLVLLLLGTTVIVSIVRRSYGALGALVALSVSIAGFNGLESNPSIMVLFGAVFAMVWAGPSTSGFADFRDEAARVPATKPQRARL